MKITIKTATITVAICDHGETEPLDDSRISSSFVVQEVNYFRAAERKLIARGQGAFDQTIHVFQVHTHSGNAQLAMLDRTQRQLQGLVEFELMGPNRALLRRYLRDGIVMLVNAWNTGKASEYIYRIMGGVLRGTP